MKRPLAGVLTALLMTGAALAGATEASAAPHTPTPTPVAAPDFAGTVALSNCSGSLIRTPGSLPEDPALVLSNGHCLETGMPAAGAVVVDQPSSRTFDLLAADGGEVGTVQATKISYATMTSTDVSLYQLGSSYAEIEDAYGIEALDLAAERPAQGTDISVVSGYWKRIYDCSIDGFAHQLREADWTWDDSVRYATPGCEVIGGTSGSPVVDNTTGEVVAVNNTINESGGRCTLNNPCEVDQDGAVTVRPGVGYAQQTYGIAACVGEGNSIDLGRPGCELPKPTVLAPRS
ncbi:trypsin-like peptidase domain-containing protein [Streptomyces sp. TP-A0874]|uniref:trypsin-like peptidase domain-containing protein n=1 Tax=Streptomyces sp. TP-A0874 TaxID=549819 RepID=UPI0008538D36|nr:trypsin-like peptidase domain-containing protein [Streptomyces sp. TP-A0874]